MTPSHHEYTIRPGDSLTRIIYNMYGWTPHNQPTTYRATLKGVLALNPHIKNPDHIAAGTLLRLPEHPTSAVLQQVRPIVLKQQGFVTESLASPAEKERLSAFAWMAHNSNWLTIPGSIATGTASGLLNQGNRQLLTDIGDLYAEYKNGKISASTYQSRRVQKIEQFKQNIGPFERMLYPDKGVTGAMRGNRSLLPSKLTASEVARLERISKYAMKGGLVLTGVGVTAACVQIAQTANAKEKNEIFVDTLASSATGFVVGLFLVSNPIGWGTALVLAIGGAAVSYGAGKLAVSAYDTWGNNIDLVSGTGVGNICK